MAKSACHAENAGQVPNPFRGICHRGHRARHTEDPQHRDGILNGEPRRYKKSKRSAKISPFQCCLVFTYITSELYDIRSVILTPNVTTSACYY